MHEMLRLVVMGLDEGRQNEIEALCDADWDQVECVDGGFLAVRGRPERFLLEWEFKEFEQEAPVADVELNIMPAVSAPVESASSSSTDQNIDERQAARTEYMALIKAGAEDLEALWIECVDLKHHDPHWWLLDQRQREHFGCTGAGWV